MRLRSGSRVLLATMVYLAIAAAAESSSGQGPVENAAFDSELQPWVNDFWFNGTAEWTSFDRNNDENSGSALLVDNSEDFFSRGTAVGQIGLPIRGDAYYVFGASAFVPSGQLAGGVARVSLVLFSQLSSSCEGAVLSDGLDAARTTDDWVDFVKSVHAPSNATCAWLYLVAAPDTIGNQFELYFDSAILREAMFADGFDRYGNTSEWSLTVMSLTQ